MTVLLLGGTAEARALATRLVAEGVDVVTSLAGVVGHTAPPSGRVRVGGFGGADGLASYLREQRIDRVVDATHPFAARITGNAASACAATGTPLLRLSRPGWTERPDAAGWHWVDSLAAARVVAEGLGRRVFLSIGRQQLDEFADWSDRDVLVRMVEPPDHLPTAWTLILARGPFSVPDERALLREHSIEVLVTKDSGGSATAAKLDAAALEGVAVVIVRRPPDPPGVPVVSTVADALAWVLSRR